MLDMYDESFDNQEDEEETESNTRENKYLGIMYNCCGIYGRIYKNKEGTAYIGRCPKCMRSIRVAVGSGGTEQRFFNAY